MRKEEALLTWGRERVPSLILREGKGEGSLKDILGLGSKRTLVSTVRGKWPSSTCKKEVILFSPQGMRSEGPLSFFLGKEGFRYIVGVEGGHVETE
jgi:hypothetical protein